MQNHDFRVIEYNLLYDFSYNQLFLLNFDMLLRVIYFLLNFCKARDNHQEIQQSHYFVQESYKEVKAMIEEAME